MLARAFCSLLPDLDNEQSLEVAALYSLRGALRERAPTATRPPFRAPHHSMSRAGLIGGGSGLARPGEISLAKTGHLIGIAGARPMERRWTTDSTWVRVRGGSGWPTPPLTGNSSISLLRPDPCEDRRPRQRAISTRADLVAVRASTRLPQRRHEAAAAPHGIPSPPAVTGC